MRILNWRQTEFGIEEGGVFTRLAVTDSAPGTEQVEFSGSGEALDEMALILGRVIDAVFTRGLSALEMTWDELGVQPRPRRI